MTRSDAKVPPHTAEDVKDVVHYGSVHFQLWCEWSEIICV